MFKKLFEFLKHRQFPLPLLFIFAVVLYGCVQQDLKAEDTSKWNSARVCTDDGKNCIHDTNYTKTGADTHLILYTFPNGKSVQCLVVSRYTGAGMGTAMHCVDE